MTDNNLQQAYLPQGCTVLVNTNGTAPGCAFAAQGKHVLMLPGPPRECRAMLHGAALPYLRRPGRRATSSPITSVSSGLARASWRTSCAH